MSLVTLGDVISPEIKQGMQKMTQKYKHFGEEKTAKIKYYYEQGKSDAEIARLIDETHERVCMKIAGMRRQGIINHRGFPLTPSRDHKQYTRQEDLLIIAMFEKGCGMAEIAAALPGRSEKGINQRILRLRKRKKVGYQRPAKAKRRKQTPPPLVEVPTLQTIAEVERGGWLKRLVKWFW